jgi:hypothetical protein
VNTDRAVWPNAAGTNDAARADNRTGFVGAVGKEPRNQTEDDDDVLHLNAPGFGTHGLPSEGQKATKIDSRGK